MNPNGNPLVRKSGIEHPASKRVKCFYPDHKFAAIYDTLTEASKITGISQPSISNAIKRHGKAGGYFWEYAE